LKSSVIVGKHHSTVIEVGSTATIQKEGDKEKRVFTIVGSEEADMATGKISNRSPLGEALLKKKKGDTVTFMTPKGAVQYKVLSIE
jgi:transcription elongation factor GreA